MISWVKSIVYRLWSIQFLRFLTVGGLNTVFGYAVFAMFTLLHLHYILAALLGQICGVLFNFKTTGTLVFKNKDNRLILRFFGVYLVTYLLGIGILRIFDTYNVNILVAAAIMVLPMAFVGFLLMRKFVFQSQKKIVGKRASTFSKGRGNSEDIET